MIDNLSGSGNGAEDYPSYRTRLFVVITSIFIIFIVLTSCITYIYISSQVTSEFNNARLQTEKTFVSSAILTEYGVESFDSQYDFLLHDRILSFHKSYQKNRNNPWLINLQSLKKELSQGVPGEIELFMINKKGIVDYTTYKPDYKKDFSQYNDFFSSLDRIRKGTDFKSDPWIRDYTDGTIYWKYGYLPTDDHEYLLEIGLRNENYAQMHKDMVFQLRRISSESLAIPGLIHIEVYDKAHRKQAIWTDDEQKNLSMITGLFHEDDLEQILNRVFESKNSSVIDNPGMNQVISIQYINLSTTRSVSGAELSYVGFLIFSTENIEKSIQWYKNGIILVTLISSLLALIIAQHLSGYISRPIEMMTDDVEIIASSSLTHSVRATGLNETERLRRSINRMVSSINVYISNIEISEKELKNELILREKAELSLAKANKRLTQLSQITRHDILNQITALDGYLEEIPDTADKQVVDEYAARAHSILEKITMLLRFTYYYENIGHDEPVWQNIGDLLRKNQHEFVSQITIIHDVDDVEILATPLMSKVIYNLIDNTIRHGTTASIIRIFFEERGETGCLVYQDNGKGISAIYKERVFERGFGKGTGLGMAFIREVLESDDMRINERGVEGHGVSFEITIPNDHYRIIQNKEHGSPDERDIP